ncbi:MAG: high-affinity branched-chain amino acid ABC transporter permease LivM [Deltaproteobacteria bacterium]|nr:high-affinity branched-chain amino acid ABC transporter permease LivM [Deltaproteobacteria bacterium]
MNKLNEIKKSFLASLWFMFLTFPIMVIRVNTVQKEIEWRWQNMFFVGISVFFLSFAWRFLFRQMASGRKTIEAGGLDKISLMQQIMNEPKMYYPILFAFTLFAATFPFIFNIYQVNIMTTALMYVVLGLGLNIVVGLAGLLDLGYVAFYLVGAYSYALLNYHFGLSFWLALPIGAFIGALFGILLGFPVLRMRGDYLAIVTLGFGEIIRIIMENWNEFSFGPSGIANIPRPGFFGIEFSLQGSIIFMYFFMICLTLFTIFIVNRLRNSRIGRAWVALREDEVACQVMGIDRTKTKLTAFALGATWAGMVGVIFAAKTTFINPASFTVWESITILCIVVLGGMGSIIGVIFGAFILILLPEYLRAFSEYRMVTFGAVLVIMMVFRPQGIVPDIRHRFKHQGSMVLGGKTKK